MRICSCLSCCTTKLVVQDLLVSLGSQDSLAELHGHEAAISSLSTAGRQCTMSGMRATICLQQVSARGQQAGILHSLVMHVAGAHS